MRSPTNPDQGVLWFALRMPRHFSLPCLPICLNTLSLSYPSLEFLKLLLSFSVIASVFPYSDTSSSPKYTQATFAFFILLLRLRNLFLKIYLVDFFKTMWEELCTCDCWCPQRSEVMDAPASVVLGGCELPDVGAGNQIQVPLREQQVLLNTAIFIVPARKFLKVHHLNASLQGFTPCHGLTGRSSMVSSNPSLTTNLICFIIKVWKVPGSLCLWKIRSTVLTRQFKVSHTKWVAIPTGI